MFDFFKKHQNELVLSPIGIYIINGETIQPLSKEEAPSICSINNIIEMLGYNTNDIHSVISPSEKFSVMIFKKYTKELIAAP